VLNTSGLRNMASRLDCLRRAVGLSNGKNETKCKKPVGSTLSLKRVRQTRRSVGGALIERPDKARLNQPPVSTGSQRDCTQITSRPQVGVTVFGGSV
jgi:hypothetical protein